MPSVEIISNQLAISWKKANKKTLMVELEEAFYISYKVLLCLRIVNV